MGLRLLAQPLGPARAAGLFLLVLGLSLALGLLQRRRWARWVGVLGAALLAGFAIRLVATGADVLEHLLLLAALAAAVLLLVPATGDPRRSAATIRPARRGTSRLLGLTTLIGLTGLVGSAWWAALRMATAPATRATLPAAAIGRSIRWSDFATGLEQARREGKPLLVTFFTTWCPYCKKMDQTWRAAQVVDRVNELVAVRINAEEDRERNGYAGQALAARYEVQGYPTLLLLDGEGQVLSRADGFLSPGQLLDWLDEAPGTSGASVQGALQGARR